MYQRGRLSRHVREIKVGDRIKFRRLDYVDQDEAERNKPGDESTVMEIQRIREGGRTLVQFRVMNDRWLKPVELNATIDIPETEAERLGIKPKTFSDKYHVLQSNRTSNPVRFNGKSIE